jgi:hypothetical protein
MTCKKSPNNDIEQRGEELYASQIRPQLTAADEDKFIVIDVSTGDYEIAAQHVVALETMLARHGADSLYSIRVGYPAAYKLGGHMISEIA